MNLLLAIANNLLQTILMKSSVFIVDKLENSSLFINELYVFFRQWKISSDIVLTILLI